MAAMKGRPAPKAASVPAAHRSGYSAGPSGTPSPGWGPGTGSTGSGALSMVFLPADAAAGGPVTVGVVMAVLLP
jgi:hypothetical protein